MRLRGGRRSWSEAAWAVVLLAAIAASWCLAYGRTSREAWATPITYRGDSLFLLSYLKAARDGHVVPGASIEVPELNAPFTANWNDHPRTLRAVFLAAGLVSRASGLFAAMNGLLLAAHLLAGLAFFLVARRGFGARVEWAALGGLAYGLAHFLFWRSLDHLDLVLGWHIPLCILVATWAASRRGVPPGSHRFAIAVAVCVVAAVHNPYYSCLFAQFLLLAAASQALRRRGRPLDPLLLLLVLVLAFLADNAGSLAFQWAHGPNAAAARPYGNLERFALKPLELLFPPPGFGLAGWGRVAHVYWEGRIYRGEGGSPYLGIVGVFALVWLALVSALRLLRRPPQPLPVAASAIAWVVGFSVVGGLNQVVGMFGFLWLRGTNRFSIWILALALLYLVTRRLPRGVAGVALVGVLAALTVVEVPRLATREAIAATRLQVASDRQFVAAVESALPAGAMLFTMPVVEFPEGQAILGVSEYEHLRPYVHSRQLRFSFGTDKGRPREAWQAELAALPVPQMVERLESCGFDGILLNRRAFPAAAAELLEELRLAGRQVRVAHPDGGYALVRLSPRASGAGTPATPAPAGCTAGEPSPGSGSRG